MHNLDPSAVGRGDASMTDLEATPPRLPSQVWIAEYQEGLVMLVRPDAWDAFERVCAREKAPGATSFRQAGSEVQRRTREAGQRRQHGRAHLTTSSSTTARSSP